MPAIQRSLRRSLFLCLLAVNAPAGADTGSNSAWQCQPAAGKKGGWECQVAPGGGPGGQPYHQTYPDAYARPAAQTTGDTFEPQWQCEPGPGEARAWDCQRRPLSAGETAIQAHGPLLPFADLDWYPNPGGVDPQTHCDGAYIQPAFDFEDATQAPSEQAIHVEAGQARTQDSTQTELAGGIYLRQGNNQLRSQSALLEHDQQRAQANGLVQFRAPGTLILGDSAQVDLEAKTTAMKNARFVFHPQHLRGSAARVVTRADGIVEISDGAYTRCEPGNDSWMIHGSKIVLDKEVGFGSARHATLRIGGVPVLYVPVIHFPIDDRRKSGFLNPSIAHTTENGLDVAAPYYFNLAPNYDDTLTPRVIARRGLMLENEFRYLGANGRYELSTAYLADDDLRGEDRWALGLDHSGRPAPGWSSRINYNKVSDNDYFDELDTDLNIARDTHLDQLAQLQYQGRSWQALARLQDYQTISSTAALPYRKVPELRLNGSPDSLPLQWRYMAEFTEFDRDPSGFSGIARITGRRLHLETTLERPYSWPWAFFNPRLRLTHTRYQLDNQPAGNSENPDRTLPLASLDGGLFFERDLSFNNRSYIQTLEPRLFYLYVPFRDQSELPDFDSSELTFSYSQLFRDNRFSGLDRIGDTNQVTLGLTSRVLQADGAERIRASLGQIVYLEDRDVRLDPAADRLIDERSRLAAEALWNLSDNLRLSADGEWSQDLKENRERNFKLRYQSDIDHQLNLSYRYAEDTLDQADFSAIWPLNARWSLLARWLQDRQNDEALDQIAGLEYENCCWRVRTLYRRWIDDDEDRENRGLYLQFILKGLGTIGTRASGDQGPKAKYFLEEISGFQEREDYDN
ncbi:LPS-assembly protein LptD [Motiliproteus sp. SC1-56]|uniref:LPS-assembly protein LptD n=1 Tax=Motiliproteus sp. SC1-56 TaxID=2799565 RepID=UPI001A8E0BE0|nr:LPS-assembly protein LptD [Motiliproteus sp. SC1-56]